MRIHVSLPDETLRQAERAAKSVGMNRSEFVARAVEHYVEEVERATLTSRINAAIRRSGNGEGSTDAVRAGRAMLSAIGDEW